MTADSAAAPWDLQSAKERDFFARLGDGLVVVLPAQPPGRSGGGAWGPPHGGAWIHVRPDGTAHAFTGKAEVGQGTRTALSLLVAEELRLPLTAVELTMGDTDLCPWDMGTFGSRSMPDAGEHLRRTAAAARTALTELAARHLSVPASELVVRNGRVLTADGSQSVGFGELLAGQRRVETASSAVRPRPPDQWDTAGRSAVNPTLVDVVTGRRLYVSDIRRPGMWHGKVLFPPAQGATLRSVDLTEARAIPGTVVVHDGDFVGVAAPDLLTATAAIRAVHAEWEFAPQPTEREVVTFLRTHPVEGEDSWDTIREEKGEVEAALRAAAVTERQTYTAAFIAHVPMETHCAVAEWSGDRLTVWVGTQTPFRNREALSELFGIPESRVHVIVPPTGSGFGGKHGGEVATGSARLAKASGHPVRVAFSREDEFTQGYLRPLAVIDVASGCTADGTIVAWRFHNVNGGAAGAWTPYRIPNLRIDNQPADSPLPQGPYRAIAATANNFARESHIDELAVRFGIDPVEYRLRHLADDRLAAVLRVVAERAGWKERTKSPGRGYGVAVGLEKGGRVATFAEVSVSGRRKVEVARVVTGYECGAIVNPDNLRSQIEGATVMGLGGALFEAVHFDRGRILNPRLSQYRVPRFHDVPAIEVVLVDRKDLPSAGAGETPLIAIAPALAAAIQDATGTRLRGLPLAPNDVVP